MRQTTVDEYLNMIDETLEGAFTIPLTGKRMVDADDLRNLIDQVRLTLPPEIREAKKIVRDRNDIIMEARKEADAVVKKAEGRARVLVSETEIVKQSAVEADEIRNKARQQAAEILASAQNQAKEMNMSMAAYCDKVLQDTEAQVEAGAAECREAAQAYNAKATKRIAELRELRAALRGKNGKKGKPE